MPDIFKLKRNNMKRYSDLFTVNFMNLGALLFAENIPSINIIEDYCKVFVLVATLIYTIAKIVALIKNMRKNEIPKNLD